MNDKPCTCCGDLPAHYIHPKKKTWVCEECFAELAFGEITNVIRRRFNVPHGMSIIPRTGVPGTGEGADYFGNHT